MSTRTRSMIAILAVVLTAWLAAPASATGIGVKAPVDTRMELADGVVTGLGNLLGTRPHLRSLDTHVSDVAFDGGTAGDGFALSCGSPVTGSLNELRAQWTDSDGVHTFTVGEVVTGFCPEQGDLDVYVGVAEGVCDGAPAVATLNFSKDEGSGEKTAGIAVAGEACELIDDDPSDGDVVLLTGDFDGCLAFTDDADECDADDGDVDPKPSMSGRMTGGGSFGEVLVARHGITLYCTSDNVSNLQVNWTGGSSFHLGALTDRYCSDSDGDGSFDTFEGSGTGKCGSDTQTPIDFKFVDEASGPDYAEIRIAAGAVCPGLDEAGYLNQGDHTAHTNG